MCNCNLRTSRKKSSVFNRSKIEFWWIEKFVQPKQTYCRPSRRYVCFVVFEINFRLYSFLSMSVTSKSIVSASVSAPVGLPKNVSQMKPAMPEASEASKIAIFDESIIA
jgi:hypothetical protein